MVFLELIFTVFLSLEISGDVIRPVVSLWPNWIPVYNKDSVTLICNVPPSALGNQGFKWYRNNKDLRKYEQNLTIPSAHVSDRGNYQCQTDTSDKSDSLRLDVSADWLVLQAPPTVRQGDSLIIRCPGWNGYNENSAVFYKDGIILQLPVNKSVLNAGKANRNKTGNYKCSKEYGSSSLQYSKEGFIYIEEGPTRPVLSLSPNWIPILTGDPVTLICSLASTVQENGSIEQKRRYSWYRDGSWIEGDQQSIMIRSSKPKNSGSYQCQAGASERSDPVILEVKYSSARFILQTPISIHEGDFLTLRCHSLGHSRREMTLYKDNETFLTSFKDNNFELGRVDINASAKYRCSDGTNSDERFISVTELFGTPQIEVIPDQVTEGDHMTITCDTKLSPHRATTELQFVFYRNGHNVQGFSLSNQYGVPSAQLEDSGKYTCEVQTPTGSVRKRSNMLHVQIQGGSWRNLIPAVVGTFLVLLLIIGTIVTMRKKLTTSLICRQQPIRDKEIVRSTTGNKRVDGKRDNMSLTLEQSNDDGKDYNCPASGLAMSDDQNYACIDMNHDLKVLSFPASSSEHDKLSVTYAVLKGDNRRKDIGSSNMEDAPNSSIRTS